MPFISREQMGIQQGYYAIQQPMVGFPPPCILREEPSDHHSAHAHLGGNPVLVTDVPDVLDEEIALVDKKFLVLCGPGIFLQELQPGNAELIGITRDTLPGAVDIEGFPDMVKQVFLRYSDKKFSVLQAPELFIIQAERIETFFLY